MSAAANLFFELRHAHRIIDVMSAVLNDDQLARVNKSLKVAGVAGI